MRCSRIYPCVDGIWDVAPGFVPSGFTPDRRDHLSDLEDRHFWFGPRDALVTSRLDALTAGHVDAAIELGCGSGRLLPVLAERARRVVGVEGHAASLVEASARDTSAVLVHADLAGVPFEDGSFDLAVALDVLEHLPPLPFLTEAHRLVRPGGHLLLTVPAFPILWSRFDELAGHRCRYVYETLRRELVATGWEPLGHTHYQMLLFPLVLWSRLRQGGRPDATERNVPSWIGRLLGRVNGFEVRSLGGRRLPYGSSLMAWARRPR